MDAQDPIREMSTAECWERVAAAPYGRLAMAVAGEVDIVPVNVVVAEGSLYFRSAPGSKLAEMAANPRVAFEIDGFDESSAWSVVVHGVAERLERQADIDAADQLPLTPWIPTLKYRWVRIDPASIRGRHFRRGVEPERY